MAHPDRINHLWTLSFCASFASTASTVNNWTYSLVDAVYAPRKDFLYDCWGSFEDLWQYRKTCFGFLGSLDTSNGAQNNYLTPVWSLIQMYLFLSRPFCLFVSKKKICFISMKKAACSYDVSSISAICMVSSESWKRLHPN